MSFFLKDWLMIRFHCGWGANNKWFWDLFPPIDQLCGHYCQRWTTRKPLEIFSNKQFLPSIDKQLRKTDLCKSKKPASLDLVALTVRSQACCLPCCSEEPVSPLKDLRIQQYLSIDDLLQELGRDSPGFLVAALQRERRCERGAELGSLRRKLGRLSSLASWGSELDL